MKLPAPLLRQCWFLAGPTASGKSAAALHLSQELNAEILSLDSMAIFRGMDIGTAKPTLAERARVAHHLLDLAHPADEFSTAQYLQAALTACEDILSRGKTPLFVGGTGLYLRSLLRGVFEGPPADWDYRNALEAESRKHGPDWLHAKLIKIDPLTAARLHPNDARRIVRALEIHHHTGTPASQLQTETPLPPTERPQHVYWLSPPRDWLAERVNARVEQMFADGLLNECRQLLADPRPPGRTARQALAYREIFEWLESDPENAIRPAVPSTLMAIIQTRTRQFAKRQHTWFRNLEECRAIELYAGDSAESVAQRVLQAARSNT